MLKLLDVAFNINIAILCKIFFLRTPNTISSYSSFEIYRMVKISMAKDQLPVKIFENTILLQNYKKTQIKIEYTRDWDEFVSNFSFTKFYLVNANF